MNETKSPRTLLDIEQELIDLATEIGDLEESGQPIPPEMQAALTALVGAESSKADALIALTHRLQSQAALLESDSKLLAARAKRLTTTRGRILKHVAYVMGISGLITLRGALGSITRMRGRKHLEIRDASKLWFGFEKVTRTWDYEAIGAAVTKEPEKFAGIAEMVEGDPYIVVRT